MPRGERPLIVLGREDGGVSVRDTRMWNETALQSEHKRPVRALAISPDKKWLATGDDDGLIALWDTATWQRIGELRGHTQAVTHLAWRSNGATVVSAGSDAVTVWGLDVAQALDAIR